MHYVLCTDSWWSQWELYTAGAVLWGAGSVSQSMHHITVQLPLAQVQDRWIHIKPWILCQLLLYRCWWVLSPSYASLILNTFMGKQRFTSVHFYETTSLIRNICGENTGLMQDGFICIPSLIREYFGRNKLCAWQCGWNQNFNQNMFMGCTSLGSSLETQVSFKLLQGSIWEASFIWDTFIEAQISLKILLCAAQLEQQVWFRKGMCTTLKYRFGVWYFWRKLKFDSGLFSGNTHLHTHDYFGGKLKSFFLFFEELFKKIILNRNYCIFQTTRCMIFLQFLSLHDLQTEVSISNTVKPWFVVFVGDPEKKNDRCGGLYKMNKRSNLPIYIY
jgi:hypothetical protein